MQSVIINPEDNRMVFLELPGLRGPKVYTDLVTGQPAIAGMVTHIQLSSEFKSAAGDSPWFYNAWYTLNSISESDPFEEAGVSRPSGFGMAYGGVTVSGAGLEVYISVEGRHSVKVLSLDGKTAAFEMGSGRRSYTFSGLRGPGVYLVVISTPQGVFMEKAALF